MKLKHLLFLLGVAGLGIVTGTFELIYELMTGKGKPLSAPSRDELARHRARREAESRALLDLDPETAIAG